MSVDQVLSGPREHLVQFYDSDADLAVSLCAYFSEALLGDGKAIAIGTAAHGRAVLDALTTSGVDVVGARRCGRLLMLDAAETLAEIMDGDHPDAVAFERVVGTLVREAGADGRELHLYGEMVHLLWEAGNVTAAIELEDLWNQLRDAVPFRLLCAYATGSIGACTEAVNDVCHAHCATLGLGPEPAAIWSRHARERARQFAGVASSIGEARRFVGETLVRWERGEMLDDAQLIVSELAANAVRHARSDFIVAVSQRAGNVRVSVRDRSPHPPAIPAPAPSSDSGRGLVLVSALSPRWGTNAVAGGKVVWAELA